MMYELWYNDKRLTCRKSLPIAHQLPTLMWSKTSFKPKMVIAVESNNTRMFKKDANNAISRCTKHHPPKCWWLQRLIKMQVKRSPHTVFAVSTIFHSFYYTLSLHFFKALFTRKHLNCLLAFNQYIVNLLTLFIVSAKQLQNA